MKVLFLENDTQKDFENNPNSISKRLEFLGIEVEKYIFELSKMDRSNMLDTIALSKHPICTACIFTINPYTESNSYMQAAVLLAAIGRNWIVNKTYIDVNLDYLFQALKRMLNDDNLSKHHVNILKAIENNYILCYDSNYNLKRVMIDFSSENILRLIPHKL